MPSTPTSSLYVGLMSGTSLDGIDAALVDFSGPSAKLLAAALSPFATELREELAALQRPGVDEIFRAALAANDLARAYAASVQQVLASAGVSPAQVAAIGMHGQTIRHRPELGVTLQIGNAALLAELTGIDVVTDFRSRDVAAGGQGAPLVPAFHQGQFGGEAHRVIVNIGGIANLTDLPPSGRVRGWDTGPGNVLMDGWIARHLGNTYDASGVWAARGTAQPTLLESLLSEPYFSKPPPKSTGRDLFNAEWLESRLVGDTCAPEDIQATLLELTAATIASAVQREAVLAREVYVCGGGAHNTALMRRLATLLAPRSVESTAVLGVDPDWVEAIAFAWLARQRMRRLPGNSPNVTGASGARVLGAVHSRD